MAYGFVYLLGNKAMPCFYKIGCTERSPHQRARELSSASGVPSAFDVLLYIEVDDFQRVETRFHREMADFRATKAREFFCFGPEHMTWLWYVFEAYEEAVAFASPKWHAYSHRPRFPDDHEETWIFEGGELALPDSPPLAAMDFQLIAA